MLRNQSKYPQLQCHLLILVKEPSACAEASRAEGQHARFSGASEHRAHTGIGFPTP